MSIKGKQQKTNKNAYTCQPSHLNYIFPLFSPPTEGEGLVGCVEA